MKPAFQIAICVVFLGYLAITERAVAATPATTAVYRSDGATTVTPVRHYRPYGAYYGAYPRRYYTAYRPYVYRPYVAAPYYAYPAYPAYGYGYPYSIRSPYYFGYRYPGARARGYYAYPRVYRRYGW